MRPNQDPECGSSKERTRGPGSWPRPRINIVGVGEDEDGVFHNSIRWRYGNETICVTVPRLDVAGAGLLDLAARGAPVTQANRLLVQEFLARQEQANLHLIPRIRVYTRFGWSKDQHAFVLGHSVIGDVEGIVNVDADKRFLAGLAPHGDGHGAFIGSSARRSLRVPRWRRRPGQLGTQPRSFAS